MTGPEVAAYLVEHGGGTFDRALDAYEPTSGYAVGMARGDAAVLPLTCTPEHLTRTMRRVAQEYEATFVGLWLDGASIVVDPVRVLTSRVTALDAARRYGQRAIYDFGIRSVVEVG